jgi:hypothetical protein
MIAVERSQVGLVAYHASGVWITSLGEPFAFAFERFRGDLPLFGTTVETRDDRFFASCAQKDQKSAIPCAAILTNRVIRTQLNQLFDYTRIAPILAPVIAHDSGSDA